MERDHNNPDSPSDDRCSGGNDDGDGNTPPKALTGGLEDVVVSSSPQETSRKKRGRVEEQGGGGSSSGGGKEKKKGELTDPPSTDPRCATCGKIFGSWKAVFGHLRSHPERDYRGAFPPPKMWEEMLRQEAVRRQHGQDQGSSTMEMARTGMSPPPGRGIGIDLNDPEEPHRPPEKGGFPFDLNMPAPESDEEDHK